MYTIAVVEDNDEDIQNLKSALSKFFEERKETYSLKIFRDGFEFLEKHDGNCDVVLLDVMLTGIDGMSVAKELRAKDDDVCIIFVTNMIQFAVNGYEVDAVGYILKPLDYTIFKLYMGRALRLAYEKKEEPMVSIKTKGRTVRIQIRELLYVESSRHDLLFHAKDGVLRTYGKLSNIEEILTEHHFYRCNQSYLVNLRYVDTVESGFVLIKEERLAISRRRKTEFLQQLNKYWSDGGGR